MPKFPLVHDSRSACKYYTLYIELTTHDTNTQMEWMIVCLCACVANKHIHYNDHVCPLKMLMYKYDIINNKKHIIIKCRGAHSMHTAINFRQQNSK